MLSALALAMAMAMAMALVAAACGDSAAVTTTTEPSEQGTVIDPDEPEQTPPPATQPPADSAPGTQPPAGTEPSAQPPAGTTPPLELAPVKPAPPSSLPVTTAPPPPADGTPPPTLADPPAAGPVDTARRDLASRLGVEVEEVGVVSVEEVTWRDGSLGCPQPGMAYTQALVNGMRIELAVGASVYEYHTGGTGDPFYCADPQEPLPPDAGGYGDS